jgi:hypothetical protein
MIPNDEKKKLNMYIDDFIKDALHNNHAVIDDSIIYDIKEKTGIGISDSSSEEILDYIYDLVKTDTRIHFYGIGEVYNYNGEFKAITDNPIITSKVFDNPFDAKNEEK